MYRASRTNKDKALILLHNNPIETLLTSTDPDDPYDDLGVDKYIPSLYSDSSQVNILSSVCVRITYVSLTPG